MLTHVYFDTHLITLFFVALLLDIQPVGPDLVVQVGDVGVGLHTNILKTNSIRLVYFMAEFSWYFNPASRRIEIELSYWDLHGVSSRIMWPRSLTSGYSKRPCKGYFRAYLSRLQMLFCRSAFIVHHRNNEIPFELMKTVNKL